MPPELRKLPIGIQSFEKLILENTIYVDKTKYIYELIKNGFGNYFFSRPRRFGKSLLISTLEEIFSNRRELFKGLWIDSSDYQWKAYPVIKISFTAIESDSAHNLKQGLIKSLLEIAESHELKLSLDSSPERLFRHLIKALFVKFQEKVVILIDEYDNPIIDNILNLELASENRTLLSNFYKALKDEDEYIRFIFFTGVSKFSKTSIFSGLNNLVDISMEDSFTTLLGYTEEEILKYFPDYLKRLAESQSLSIQETLAKIKYWYNGYRFSKKDIRVYNPWSLMSALEKKDFLNYWFQTGTPRFLIDLIKRDGFGLSELNKIENIKEIKHDDLVTYDIESLPLLPILVDTGYLTIKNIEMFGDERVYLLDYPNREVNVSILNNILPAYSEKQSVNVNSEIIAISRSINSGDLNKFFSLLKSYFASIPYELIEKKRLNEKYFQLLFYLLMRVTGFMVNTEDRTSSGRIDMVLETSSKIYLFEFKVNSTSRLALEQIKEKKYYEKYENVKDKKLLLVGINFDLNSKNISETEVIEWN
jgi:hypothetical protein